jgi:hypothetical protein
MKILTKDQFMKLKKSDTLIVYGSGSSINRLTEEEKKKLMSFDSIGFNWFCKSRIPTTFYLIREQAATSKRLAEGETRDDLFDALTTSPYNKSCLIILKLKQVEAFHYEQHLGKFSGAGVVLNDRKKRGVDRFKEFDIFKDAVCHGACTLVNVLHIAAYLKYARILFVGIDLYDCRYFWMKGDRRRHTIKKKRLRSHSRHPISTHVMQSIKQYKKCYPDVQLFGYNPRSSLRRIIPIWEWPE